MSLALELCASDKFEIMTLSPTVIIATFILVFTK